MNISEKVQKEILNIIGIIKEENPCEHVKDLDPDDIQKFMEKMNEKHPSDDSRCLHIAYLKGTSSEDDYKRLIEIAKHAMKVRAETFLKVHPEWTEESLCDTLTSEIFTVKFVEKLLSNTDKEEIQSIHTNVEDAIEVIINKILERSAETFICVFSNNLDFINWYLVVRDEKQEELLSMSQGFSGTYYPEEEKEEE